MPKFTSVAKLYSVTRELEDFLDKDSLVLAFDPGEIGLDDEIDGMFVVPATLPVFRGCYLDFEILNSRGFLKEYSEVVPGDLISILSSCLGLKAVVKYALNMVVQKREENNKIEAEISKLRDRLHAVPKIAKNIAYLETVNAEINQALTKPQG